MNKLTAERERRWTGRHWLAAAVIVIGVAASVVAFAAARSRMRAEMQATFQQECTERAETILVYLHDDLDCLDSIGDFFASSQQVEREEFRHYVRPLQAREPTIHSVMWAPRVAGRDRIEFERAIRSGGLPQFRIDHFDDRGLRIPADDAPEHFPVLFAEPEWAESAIGVDLAAQDLRLETMQQALATGRALATSRVQPIWASPTAPPHPYVVVFLPVYRQPAGNAATQPVQKDVAGFLTLGIDVSDLVESSIEHLAPAGLDIEVIDETESGSPQVIYVHHTRLRSGSAPVHEQLADDPDFAPQTRTETIAGRSWVFRCSATPEFFAGHSSSMPVLVLVGGLVVTGAMGFYFLAAANHARNAKSLVRQAIADLVEANRAMRQSEQRFHTVARATSDVVWDWNLLTNELWWSEGVQSKFGYPPDEPAGTIEWWYEHIHPDDRERVTSSIHAVIDSGRTQWSDEYRYRCADGSYPIFIDRGEVIRDEQGRAVRMTGGMRDVTARRQAEDELHASQKRLADIVETALDAVVGMDAEGRVIEWNGQAERIFGWTRTEIMGRTLAESIVPESHRIAHRDGLKRFLQTGEGPVLNRRIEIQALHRSGRIFPVELSIVALDTPGARPTFSAFVRDITERVRAQEEIRQLNAELEQRVEVRTRQLQDANSELESFAYTVSHDLRAPLRAIDGFSRIVTEDHASNLDSEARRYLDLVRRNAMRMGTLIDDLLAFSRLGRQAMSMDMITPAAMARQVVAELKEAQPERAIDVTVSELPRCKCDPALLRQVFVNLLSNAFKFTRNQSNPRIDVGWQAQDGQTVYYVRDNGVGFDMRYADKLFGVFQRLHGPEEFEGTGVGLAIVQRIIHRHGGRVWAESSLGQGTTFYFTITSVGDAES